MADKCNYRDRSDAYSCARPRAMDEWCVFHFENNGVRPAPEFQQHLNGLIQVKDGDWRGFVFPRELTLRDISFDFRVDMTRAKVGALNLVGCKFHQEVDLSEILCAGDFTANSCNFAKDLNCNKAQFAGEFNWSSIIDGTARFNGCEFVKSARVYGQFNGKAEWSSSRFSDSALFHGGWIAFMNVGTDAAGTIPFVSKPLFSGETHLDGIDFRRAGRTRFEKVDFSKAFVRDTDFRGVTLHDITWATINGRRAIYDEVWDRETEARHAPMLPKLEAAYRTIRVCIEESKDFNTASDFYFGEMQARRKQMTPLRRHVVSVEALYWLLSGYGCRPARAFGVLLLLVGLHALITGALLYGAGFHLPDPELTAKALNRTLILLLPLRGNGGITPLGGWWFLLDFVFGVCAVIQTALFVLALRGRIKRG